MIVIHYLHVLHCMCCLHQEIRPPESLIEAVSMGSRLLSRDRLKVQQERPKSDGLQPKSDGLQPTSSITACVSFHEDVGGKEY